MGQRTKTLAFDSKEKKNFIDEALLCDFRSSMNGSVARFNCLFFFCRKMDSKQSKGSCEFEKKRNGT
jgi:hypothetical protein